MNGSDLGLPESPSGRGMRRLAIVVALSAMLAAPAIVAAPMAGSTEEAERNRQLASEHLMQRLPAIRAALSAAQPGFVFLAGNSHAELLGNVLARRLPAVVNGGIGGTSARRYAAELDGLSVPVRAGVAVLFLGTNDILRHAAPLSERTLGGFEAAASRSLEWLRANADLVLVAAVPPIGPEAQADRDPAAVAAYSTALRDLCDRHGCRFFDPFADLRDGEAGLTTQAAPPDGVHLRDYEALAADLETRLRALGDTVPQRRPE